MGDASLRVRQLVRKELRQMFRDPRAKRIMFGAPLLQLILFGYAVNTDVRNVALFVVDHDVTAESRTLVDAFTASGYFRVAGRSERSQDLQRALDAGRIVVGLEIPVGFSRELKAGRGAVVQVLVDGTNSNTGTIALGYANRIVQQFASRRTGSAVATATGVDLRARAWYNP
ncbi:MAG: ABC transporter permease, partial [Gemmatimonadetes bacterium]|nr:ABC transporter permease [Gemmatimonadota bacterium]